MHKYLVIVAAFGMVGFSHSAIALEQCDGEKSGWTAGETTVAPGTGPFQGYSTQPANPNSNPNSWSGTTATVQPTLTSPAASPQGTKTCADGPTTGGDEYGPGPN